MKDQRFETIHGLLLTGEIKTFTEIFEWIPHTVLAKEYGTNNARMKKMVADPSLWTLEEIYQLADLIGYDKKKLLMMAGEEGVDGGQLYNSLDCFVTNHFIHSAYEQDYY